MALKEREPELSLEVANLLTDRGLRNVQLARREREAQMASGRFEHHQRR